MKINNHFPVIPNDPSRQKPKPTVPVVADSAPQPVLVPSTLDAFEQTAHAESARFFKTESFSALAQQALAAYQRTESLSPNNPRHYLVGIDDYA